MEEGPNSSRLESILHYFYLIAISFIFSCYLLRIKEGNVYPIALALAECVSLLPVLIAPLFCIRWRLRSRLALFLVLTIPLTILGVWWTNYPDTGPFIFILYNLKIFLAIIASHYILKSLHEKASPRLKKTSIGLSIVITVIVFVLMVITIVGDIDQLNKNKLYNELRCNGNAISVKQFREGCNKLTGIFWEGYYQDLCFKEADNREINGTISKGFSCPSCCNDVYKIFYWR